MLPPYLVDDVHHLSEAEHQSNPAKNVSPAPYFSNLLVVNPRLLVMQSSVSRLAFNHHHNFFRCIKLPLEQKQLKETNELSEPRLKN